MRDFLFPRCCFHCEEPIAGKEKYFCRACQELLQLVKPTSSHFRKKPTPWTRHAALFDAAGPGKSLQVHLHEPGVLELLASLMIVQLEKLQWPMPNEITYQPYTIFQRIEKGPDLTHDLVKLLKKRLHPKKSADPIILVVTTDNRELQTGKWLRRFPKELLRLDITTHNLRIDKN